MSTTDRFLDRFLSTVFYRLVFIQIQNKTEFAALEFSLIEGLTEEEIGISDVKLSLFARSSKATDRSHKM